MKAIRPTAVAGSFYPADPRALQADLAAHFAALDRKPPGPPPKAIIAPHAGYVYSGPIAASVYSRLAALKGIVTRVVLAGPAHRVYVEGIAVPRAGAFTTPLGNVPVDEAAIAKLRALPGVEVSDLAHAFEHSLEVHLPFLQAVLGEFALVPLVVGDADPATMGDVLETLWGGPETVIVVSSDLSHYLPYGAAVDRDRRTAQAILDKRPVLQPDDACGAAPINGLLAAARRRGLEVELVDLRNSGDTAGGKDRVVGYGAFAFHEAAAKDARA